MMKNPRMGSVIRAVTQFCLHYPVGIRAWAFATRLNDISRNNIIFLKVILS